MKTKSDKNRKLHEDFQKFYSAVEQAADAIFFTDKEGNIQYVNPAFEKLTGFTKKEALGKNPRIIKSGLQSIGHYKKLWTTILSGKPFRSTVINRKKNGDLFYADHTITPIKDNKGNIINFVGIWKDVTELMLLEKRRDEFVSMAGHELRTPVTTMKLYTQILQEHFEDKKDKKAIYFLANVSFQIKRLNDLISDLLDVGRIKSGKLTHNKQFFDFDDLLIKTITDFQYASEKHQIIRQGETEKKVFADKDRIQQVLINLISNAIKYSPNANKIIVHASANKTHIKVGIQDFGIGVSKEEQKKIFEPFYRVSDAKNKNFTGLGIGLHIVSEIISRHNGKIWVESEEGKGSTFYFTLPVK